MTMIRRVLKIGRWVVEFYFATDGYDVDSLIESLYDAGASAAAMRQAVDLMDSKQPNTGFTFANPYDKVAVVAIGPTSGGDEFVNTLVHEVHHLAVAIASELGIDLESETPAYIAGDSARELATVVCELGCPCCNS